MQHLYSGGVDMRAEENMKWVVLTMLWQELKSLKSLNDEELTQLR